MTVYSILRRKMTCSQLSISFPRNFRSMDLIFTPASESLFATTVRHCGRLISSDGVSFDPKNMQALQTMCEPQNGANFVQYVAAVNWMRRAIPNYSKPVAPLQAALAKAFEAKSRRKKKSSEAVSPLQASRLWTALREWIRL
jgi:hypothetical protein